MTIAINEIQRVFRYNGVALPDVPGMTPREVRDLYSAQYPELISAEIEAGDVSDGLQEFTFRKAVGTKGGGGDPEGSGQGQEEGSRLAALQAMLAHEAQGVTGREGKLSRALSRKSARQYGKAWAAFAQRAATLDSGDRQMARVLLGSDMLAPLP